MLEDVLGSQQRVAQHDDADEHEHHGVAAEEVVEDVGMMDERSAPTVQDEGDDPEERGESLSTHEQTRWHFPNNSVPNWHPCRAAVSSSPP